MQADGWDTDTLDRLERGRVAGRWRTWEVYRDSWGWGVTLHYREANGLDSCALIGGRRTLAEAAGSAMWRVPAPSVETTEGEQHAG